MIAIVHSKKSRALDWSCGLFALFFGVVLLLPGESLPWRPEGLLRSLPEAVWATGFVIAGAARIMALRINGRMPSGSPAIRAGAAMLGAYFWSQLAVAAGQTSLALHLFLPTLAFSGYFVGAEIFLSVRAALEFMRARRRHAGSK